MRAPKIYKPCARAPFARMGFSYPSLGRALTLDDIAVFFSMFRGDQGGAYTPMPPSAPLGAGAPGVLLDIREPASSEGQTDQTQDGQGLTTHHV